MSQSTNSKGQDHKPFHRREDYEVLSALQSAVVDLESVIARLQSAIDSKATRESDEQELGHG